MADKLLSGSRLAEMKLQVSFMSPSELERFRKERPNQYNQIMNPKRQIRSKSYIERLGFGGCTGGEVCTGQGIYRR